MVENCEKIWYNINKGVITLKYCISGRQPYSILKLADEIKVQQKDADRIMDFIEQIPDKTVILNVTGIINEEDFNTWKMYDEKMNGLVVALHDLRLVNELKENDVKWYWPYPITTYYELRYILSYNPSYVELGAPLCFDLDNVKKVTKNIPLRMVVNNAQASYFLEDVTKPNYCGPWIRPEDVKYYENYLSVMEFYNPGGKLSIEQTYLDIYRKGSWPTDLSILIKNLNFKVDGQAIPEDLGQRRVNCGQRCMINGNCHLCESALNFGVQVQKEAARRR